MFPALSVVDPSQPNDPRITRIELPGAHTDIGGGYDNGVGAITLQIGRDYLARAGVPIAEVPPELGPDMEALHVHDSSTDSHNNVIWDTRPDRGVQTSANPPADPERLAELYPSHSKSIDPQSLEVRATGNGAAEELPYSSPNPPPAATGEPDSVAAGSLQPDSPPGQEAGQSLGEWSGTVPPEQASALLQMLGNLGLGSEALGQVRILNNPDGSQSIALDAGGGDLMALGQMEPAANGSGWTSVHLPGGDPDKPVHLGPQGQVFSHDAYVEGQVQTAAQGLNLFSGLVSGLQNWDQLSDLQRLNTVVSLYSQVDNFGSALGQGNHLPGDLGVGGSMLAFINAMDGGSDFAQVMTGLSLAQQGFAAWSNILVNQAFDMAGQMAGAAVVDMAMTQAYDAAISSAVQTGALAQGLGQAIPYLNLVYSLSNIEENPLGAVTAALSMMGPWGQAAAAVLTVVSMFMSKDIPPSIGEAEVHIDASTGAVVVETTRDERDGGGTAAQWAHALGQLAVAAGMSAPQAGAPAQHLPSVGYYYDPDGPNLSGSNGHLVLRWTDEDGQSRQRVYDSSGMRWDGNSVEGQSDIMRDYLLLVSRQGPLPLEYRAVEGGVLQVEYGVATALYATALGTHDGQASHTHGGDEDTDGGEVFIGAGSAQMVSLSGNTIANSTGQQTQRTLGAADIQSMGASAEGPRIPRGKEPIVFVPTQAVVGGGSRDVTAGMVRSLGEAGVISDQQLAATAMALGLSGLGFASHAGQGGGGGQGGEGLGQGAAGEAGAPGTPYHWGDLAAPGAGSANGGTPATARSAWTDEQGREVAPGGTVWRGSGTDAASGGAPLEPLMPEVTSDPVPATPAGQAATPGPDRSLPAGFGGTETAQAGPLLPARDDIALDHPTVVADGLVGTEDENLRFDARRLLENDHTPNPVPQGYSGAWYNGLRVVEVGGASHGQIGIRDGQVVFVPPADYNGTVTFEYTVQDMYGMKRSGTASIEVRAVNDAPVARGESATGSEDATLLFTAASLLRNDTDVDGDRLRISRVGEATGGTVYLQPDGSVRFVPTPDYNGPAGYAYWVSDGHEQVRAEVRLNILPVNDLPVVQGEWVDSDEDVVLDFPFGVLLANDSDVDTDPALNRAGVQTLTISAVGNAQHGTVQIVDGQVRFTPDRDYFGPASFDYLVDDGAGGQVSTTVILNLAPVNDAPEVQGESATIAEDNAIIYTQAALLANDSDVDNDHADLRITQVGGAVNGSVELLPDGRIRFVPDADYFGPAAFDYLVDDGVGGQALGTVTLEVTPVNDDPRLQGERVEIDEDTVVTVRAADLLANDHDVDNDHADLVLTEVGGAVNGSVAMDAQGNITFTPTANYYGQASFTYTVIDGVGGRSTATMVLDYLSVNDLPVVNGEVVAGKRGITYTFDDQALLANDTDVEHPGQLQIVAVGGARNGTVEMLPNGDVRFVPAGGYEGWSPAVYGSFEYTVRDPDGGEAIGVVAIDYSTVNLNPIAVDDRFKGYEDVKTVINVSELLRNDRDPDATAWSRLAVEEVGSAKHGSVSLNNGVVTFNPHKDFYGEASFRYRVSDGEGGSTWATAYIDVERANQLPVITGIEYFTGNDATLYTWNWSDNGATYAGSQLVNDPHRISGRIYAYDPDGDTLTFTVTSLDGPQHGVAFVGEVIRATAPAGLDHVQLQGKADIPAMKDPSIPDGGRRNYLVSDYVGTGSGAYAGWQYTSWKGDGYKGPESFVITVTDSRGGSVTSAPIQVTHEPWTGGGGCFPVVVDTGSDGIDLVSPDESKMFVDINGDGWRDRIGWVAATDALLAYDGNDDGLINQREEVSFVGYQPGARTDMEGLAAFDTNGDGVLSAADDEWHRFGLLQDANGNGVQDEGEWQKLEDLGVKEVSLRREGEAGLNNGNVVFGTSTITYEDGRTQTAADVMFAGDGVALPDWVEAELGMAAGVDATSADGVAAAGAASDSLSEPELETAGHVGDQDDGDVPGADAALATPSGQVGEGLPSQDAPPADETVAEQEAVPSIDQQASAFVQMVTTQVEPSEPIAYVDIQEVSLSGGSATVSVSTDEPKVDIQGASTNTADLAVPA